MNHPTFEQYLLDLILDGYGVKFWRPKSDNGYFTIRLSHNGVMGFRRVSLTLLSHSVLPVSEALYLELEQMVRELNK